MSNEQQCCYSFSRPTRGAGIQEWGGDRQRGKESGSGQGSIVRQRGEERERERENEERRKRKRETKKLGSGRWKKVSIGLDFYWACPVELACLATCLLSLERTKRDELLMGRGVL